MQKLAIDTPSGPGTTVGVNVSLSGTLKDQNDIVVHGIVDGEVISESSVIIGETAQVKGPIRGQLVSIAGTVHGEVTASDKLELLATGKVYGSITTNDLVVHSGAILSGKSVMGEQSVDSSSEVQTAPAEPMPESPAEEPKSEPAKSSKKAQSVVIKPEIDVTEPEDE